MGLLTQRNPEEKQAREIADKIADEIARREKNAGQLRTAETALVSCRATVERFALDGDEGELDAALETQSTAEKKATALRAASVKIAATIADLEAEAAAVADRRQRQATAIEIEKVARDLERAGAAFAEVAAELAAASRRADDLVPDAHPLRVYTEAAALEVSPAVVMVAEVLRHRAVLTINGQAAAIIPGPVQPPPKLALVVEATPTQSVFIMKPARYRDRDGRQVACGQYRVHELPLEIAERALKTRVAIPVTDKRRRDMIDPDLVRCQALDDSPLVEPKKSTIEPIVSSHVFETHPNVGKPYTMTVPVTPIEPVAVGQRSAEHES